MGRMGRMGRSRALPARPHPTRAGAIRPPTRGGPQLPSFLGTATLVGGRSYTWGMANSSQTAGAMQSPSFPRDPSSRIYLGRRPWVRGSTPSQGVPQSSDHQVASDSDSVATNVRRQDPATRRPVVGSNLRQEVSQADDQSVAGTGNMSSPPNPYHQQHNQPLTESRVPDTYYQRRNEPLVDCRVHTDGLQSVSRKRGRTYEMEDHPVEAPAARPSFQPFSNPSPYYQQRSQQLVDPRIPTDGLQNVRGEGGRAYENEDHPIQASAARPSFQPLSHPNAYHQQRDQPMIDPRATNSYYQQRTQPQVDPRVPTDGLQGVPRDGGRTHENQDRPIEAPAARKTSVQPFSPTESFTALYDDNGQDLLTFQRWAGQRERYITQARAEGREHTLPANVDSDECLQRDWAEKCAKRRGHFGW